MGVKVVLLFLRTTSQLYVWTNASPMISKKISKKVSTMMVTLSFSSQMVRGAK